MPWFTWTNQKIVIEGEWDSNLKHPVCYCCVDKFNVVYVVNIFFKRYLQKIYFCLFATWHFVSQAKNHLYFQVRQYHQQPLNFSFWRIFLFQNLNENCLNAMVNFVFLWWLTNNKYSNLYFNLSLVNWLLWFVILRFLIVEITLRFWAFRIM